jgi:methionine-S-sulfoxide reductase
MEAYLTQFKGIASVTPGYAGGTSVNPTYEMVCAEIGGHAEVVRIEYDESIISLSTLLEVFWSIHNPTTLNQQGHDRGVQYRSCIYYSDETDALVIEKIQKEMQTKWDAPIVTEIKPLDKFYEAESYHKDYFMNNPDKAYCQVVINPALARVRKQFTDLMK